MTPPSVGTPPTPTVHPTRALETTGDHSRPQGASSCRQNLLGTSLRVNLLETPPSQGLNLGSTVRGCPPPFRSRGSNGSQQAFRSAPKAVPN